MLIATYTLHNNYYILFVHLFNSHLTSNHQPVHCDNSDDDENDDVMSAYHRQNCSSPGRILYTVSYYEYGVNNFIW